MSTHILAISRLSPTWMAISAAAEPIRASWPRSDVPRSLQREGPIMPADVLNPELTQYDIPERLHWFRLDRRDFLKLCGGGLMVCLEGASVHGQESGGGFRGHELPKEVSAWLHIGED